MKSALLYFFCMVIFCCCSGREKSPPADSVENLVKGHRSPEETLDWVEANVDSVLEKHVFTSKNRMKMPYRLFKPNSDSERKVPLVVFLHGRGDRGTDNGSRVYEQVGLFMNERSLVSPHIQSKYPCYVLIPQCSDKTTNEEWAKWEGNTPETPFEGLGKDGSYSMTDIPSEYGEAALELIDSIIQNDHIDVDRVYLIGVSMGGFGTWEFTARRPELFAAAVPMAGFSDPGQIGKIKDIPYWIFHGNADKSNPVEGSRKMSKLLEQAGSQVKYTEYDGVGHGASFNKAFDEPELIPWMFSHRR